MKHWLKSVLYVPKHAKPTDENILRLLVPSFLGIILCMVCLAGTTWAWFSASVQTQPQTIEAANYEMDVTVNNEMVTASKKLEANKEYQITLTADGTANQFGGYCIIEGGEKPLYSAQLLPGDTLSFTFIPSATANYTFTAVWGSYSGEPDIIDKCTVGQKVNIQDDPQVSEPQQDNTGRKVHIVKTEDSLWEIAAQYGTTVEKIVAYNSIDQSAALQIGQEIKIPPQGYEIPSAPSSSSTLSDKSSSMPEETAESWEEESTETSFTSE